MGVAYDLLPLLEIDEAKVLLAIHSFTHDDLNDSRMDGGFMGSLRPYRGKLNHEAFHEVFACLKSLGPTLSEANTVDRRVIRDLWGICHWAREWATR
ncbi:MAG: hypothetical protein KDA59_23530, partial [Planctomycetales bacterium]|nr:hypothetical protein [Planctomycetales bacterium]